MVVRHAFHFSRRGGSERTSPVGLLADGDGSDAVQQGGGAGGAAAAGRDPATRERRVHHRWRRAGVLQNRWGASQLLPSALLFSTEEIEQICNTDCLGFHLFS